MATSRGERMQERMRGAGRHEVADDSFGFVLPVEDVPEEPSFETASPEPPAAVEPAPAPAAPTPNTSAKRRPLDPSADTAPAIPQPPTPKQPEPARPSSASKGDPYDLGRESPREEEPVIARSSSSLGHRDEVLQDVQPARGTPASLPDAVAPPSSRSSAASRGSPGQHMEEVTESPAGAPGSGHRRRVRVDDVITQSAQLQRMVTDEEARVGGEVTTSSPLARKTRQSGLTPSTLSVRSRRITGRSSLAKSIASEPDELSPAPRPSRMSNSTAGTSSARSSLGSARRSTLSSVGNEPDELSSPVPLVESRRRAQAKSKAKRARQPSPVEEHEEAEVGAGAEEDEEAEEIGVKEAARRLGRKRRRPSPPREASPELNSRIEDMPQPAKKRRQKRVPDSPAKQAQPKAQKKKSDQQSEQAPARIRQSGDREHIPIAVQRYAQQHQYNEGDTDTDILASEIPFANRGGVNVVDVLSQMCDEVIDSNLATLREAVVNAKDAAAKKEYRTKLRALEAFQEELHTRLLEHTIALDTLHALEKRVRSVQKEKLSLRNELMRIRAEREQVALKMDAVRVRHETESKRSLGQLRLSSIMHDIDLAVENGQQAPELNPKEQKAAELANLELLVSRVASEATAGVDGGGNLKQIQEFNALLERAAAALESR